MVAVLMVSAQHLALVLRAVLRQEQLHLRQQLLLRWHQLLLRQYQLLLSH